MEIQATFLYENILTNKILPITIFQQQLFVTGRISSMQLNMTKGKPLPVILMFTVPLIIGNVFQQLYNMVDTIIVGRYVGADALAAVGSTGTIMFLITGFSQGITAGFSVRVSQKYGARDQIASELPQIFFIIYSPRILEQLETARFLCFFWYFLPVSTLYWIFCLL